MLFFCLPLGRKRARMLGGGAMAEKSSNRHEPERFVIWPINATDATNSQIEDGLNNLDTTIKSIANKASSSSPVGSSFELSAVASFINSVQAEQGGSKQTLPAKKIEATQALQAAIAKSLFSRLLIPKNPLQHPLFLSTESNSDRFNLWLESQPKFEGHNHLTNDRKRQWIAKYLAENAANQRFVRRRQELVDKTMKDIEETISRVYPNWDVSLREKIKHLVESALDLTVKMMGKNLAITSHWVVPGQTFSDKDMKMTDILKSDGIIALCVFPVWKDSENLTIAKGKVYCL